MPSACGSPYSLTRRGIGMHSWADGLRAAFTFPEAEVLPKMKTLILPIIAGCIALLPQPACEAGVLDWFRSKPPEAVLKEKLQAEMNASPQRVFNAFHPVGTARRVVVHEVAIEWCAVGAPYDFSAVVGIAFRFTIAGRKLPVPFYP